MMMYKIASEILNQAIKHPFELNQIIREKPDLANFINNSIALASLTLMDGKESGGFKFGNIGQIEWPNISFGNVTSADLINLPELTLFFIYSKISSQYDLALDLGANVGLHSLVMAKAGFKKIIAVEADPFHIQKLQHNLQLNGVQNVEIRNLAISDSYGKVTFSRVLGNLTGSHIKGSKKEVYGEIDEIIVESFPIQDILDLQSRILCKMDIEGHERIAITSIPKQLWKNLDLFVEISSTENATGIFGYCQANGLPIFTEMNCWNQATKLEEIPVNWREGSALITSNIDLINQLRELKSS